jgi:predicted Zn-dependent peptidase
LEGVRHALESRLHPTNLELTVAGDFDEAELEQLVLNYMGTLRPLAPAPTTQERMGAPIVFQVRLGTVW